MPLPWRIALRTRTAMAIYALIGTGVAALLRHVLHVDVALQPTIDAVCLVVGGAAGFAALLGRRMAPVRDVGRLQKVQEKAAERDR